MYRSGAFLLLVLLVTAAPSEAENLKIVHFDIGQGDATLIWSPSGQTLLVDAGPAREPDDIRLWLQSQGISDLNYTLATHYHADHIGEFIDLYSSGYLPGIAYDRGDNPGYTTQTYYNYIAAAAPVRQTIVPGQTIDLGDGVITTTVCVNGVLMNGATYPLDDENERSICVLVEYNNFRYVVAGDLGGGSLGLYDLETPCSELIGDLDVFQMNHHGSNSSTNWNWLDNLSPEAAVVSLGDDNPYGYTHAEVVSRVNGCTTLQTLYHTEEGYNLSTKSVVINGEIILETDGFTSYTIAGDLYNLGPEVFLEVWVDSATVQPIPASGGWLYWNIFAQNLETYYVPVHVRFWLEVPNYGPYTLIDLPGYDLPPLPSGTTRQRQLYIPENAPGGMYELIGEIRDEDYIVLYATDRDTFYKDESELASGWEFIPENWFESITFIDKEAFTEENIHSSLPEFHAFPVPFNSNVSLSFTLPNVQDVKLEIFDLNGRKVAEVFEGHLGGGSYTFAWNAEAFPTGIYFARLTGGDSVKTKKLILLK